MIGVFTWLLALREYSGRSGLGRKDAEQSVRDYYDERGRKGGWVGGLGKG